MVIHQIPMKRVHVWVWLETLEGKQPQHYHSNHQPLSPSVRQNSLPELLAQEQQETKEADCFAMLISRISMQTAPAL